MPKVKTPGRKRINEKALAQCDRLKKGEDMIMPRNEWKHKEAPGAYTLRKYLKKEFSVQTLADDSGWLIKRIK